MYTVELKPTDELYADKVASNAQRWLNDCIGICEATPEQAIQKAENELGDAFKDEVDVYYTISAITVEIEE